jgi:hypothetical protein
MNQAKARYWSRFLVPLVILVPSMVGFGMKFIEFIAVYRGDAEGAFAVAPILNYLLASFGFLLLFGWAAANGMFHHIEQPKHAMLENEARLDRLTHHDSSERKLS